MTADVDIGQIKSDLEIDRIDLNASLYDQAAIRLHYGLEVNKAKAALDAAKLKLEVDTAKVDKHARAEAAKLSVKTTEKQIEAAVKVSVVFIASRENVIDAEEYYSSMQTVATSFDQRRDMLVQLSKHLGIEKQGEMALSAIDASKSRGAAAMENMRNK